MSEALDYFDDHYGQSLLHAASPPSATVDWALAALIAERVRIQAAKPVAEALGERGRSFDDIERQMAPVIWPHLQAVLLDSQAGSAATLSEAETSALSRAVAASLAGIGSLQQLLDDPRIEEVSINGCDRVFAVYADNTKEVLPPVAESDEALIAMVQRLAQRSGRTERRFDPSSPVLFLRLPDGSRLTALMEVSGRPAIAIRRHRYAEVTLDDLIALGTIDASLATFLRAIVRARKNIIVAGGPAAGKTTMLRALISEIPPQERVITAEQALELGVASDHVRHPDAVDLETREANAEGAGAIGMDELVRVGSLRMGRSRMIVGEVLGAEVIQMLLAMSKGQDGSLSTLHARSSAAVFSRIAMYALIAPEHLTIEATSLLIAQALDFIVYVSVDDSTGLRYVSSVRQIVGSDGTIVSSNEVFRSQGQGLLAHAASPIQGIEDLERYGYGVTQHAEGIHTAAAHGGWA